MSGLDCFVERLLIDSNVCNRVNMRLPHTPRSFPTAAASHYFDDVFSKRRDSLAVRRQGTLRRSSTSRSIGNRSSLNSTNGDAYSSAGDAYSGYGETEGDDSIPDESAATEGSAGGYMNEKDLKERQEADEHVANYVADQLERVRSHGSASAVHDEFEASLDGAADAYSR